MKYRILEMLDAYGIDYVDHGAGTTKGNVNIQCPFCGSADRGHHLGISLKTGYWNCWRNEAHRGRGLPTLLAEVFSMGITEARGIVDSYSEGVIPAEKLKEGFEGLIKQYIQNMSPGKAKEATPVPLPVPMPVPGSWMRLDAQNELFKGAQVYLKRRGFQAQDLQQFPLYFSLTGREAYRIIFPVTEHGVMYFWTARTISKDVGLRYLSSTKGEHFNIKDFVWPYDYANQHPQGALFVCEGPMDAFKLNALLGSRGKAICLFGKAVSKRQSHIIRRLGEAYPEGIVVVLDSDATGSEIRIANDIRAVCICRVRPLIMARNHGGEDPGALDKAGLEQALKLLRT